VPEQLPSLPPPSLATFCETVLSRHAGHWPLTEATLAQEFVTYFSLKPFFHLEDLINLCTDLGIEVSVCALPDGLKGYHHCFAVKRAILLSERPNYYVQSQEHTLLHEMRELFEHGFEDLGYSTGGEESLESRADRFAISSQLFAVDEAMKMLCDDVRKIESPWRRWGTALLLGVITVGYTAGIMLSPYLEDQFPDVK
jgi:hypothetical protein